MNGLITPIILLLASLGLFFGYVDGKYKEYSVKNTEYNQYQNALLKNTDFEDRLAELQTKRQNIDPKDQERLAKMLPSTVDSVRLIIELEGIASKYGLSLKNVSVEKKDGREVLGSNNPFGELTASFEVVAGYSAFLNFLRDLERNQRIVDIENLSVVSGDKSNIYNYSVSLKTYWLK